MIKIYKQENLKDFFLALLEVSYKISLASFIMAWTLLIFYIILFKPILFKEYSCKFDMPQIDRKNKADQCEKDNCFKPKW